MCHRLDPLWTPKQLAEYLCIPVQTLYDWNWKGAGPTPIKVGRHLRYRESDIMAWLDVQTVAA
ncbi:helix-turn-helix domain-containing protein [Arsenicicoccus dermatophilus]|uniref:helix-turn-helix transcriptional regulator n=1 Tax=Arsenicicoccus dermatophilus TaxID=1076331 RepID=UPI003892277C